MSLPSNGIPTASQVADWAVNQIGKRVDLPGSGYGAQCWDLPNYIFNRFWGFRTPRNAVYGVKNQIIYY
ncbi:hypothetical protein JJQ58_00770 [Mammaliicoccus fleurettii]|uniref:Uncharacterized protein n=1 Tax=Mammaliicoccus fleurettii TaxID=150056 RepID=A0ABS5MJD3_9STAP|nr:hypothetical protein [Mammaliicoccus fleurettii]MBS3670951.1 hypothetical protein [Mammaliicoccus fleurettii]MBS3696010.1 hypothetical protein [Mammaliicoccus fleurettii]PTE33625.1 hypothetical protein BUY94_06475 [Mammaliicoccus fleurettii]RIL50868.1 hypothetical protein BUY93_06320 [Mammaliicoccus fleurettii]